MKHLAMKLFPILFASQLGCASLLAPMDQSAGTDDKRNVPVVTRGKTKWVIQTASSNEAPVQFAAAEIQKYIKRMSNCELRKTAPANDQPAIVLGVRKDLSAADQAILPPTPKGYDGYAIGVLSGYRESEPRIIIGGDNERAVLYAAYDLLERFGCRWFYPQLDPKDTEVVPRKKNLSIPVGKWAMASPMRYRVFHWGKTRNLEWRRAQIDWAAKCRFNMMGANLEVSEEADRRGFMRSWGGHGFATFMPTEKYFKDHPEWFGMQNGKRVHHGVWGSQFCWSNPEAQDVFTSNVVAYIREHPEIDFLTLYGGDGLPACTCPQCAKANPADWEIELMNKVAAELEKIAPNVGVETLGAYKPTIEPPKWAKPHRNLRIKYAHWGRSHLVGYDSDLYNRKPQLDIWRELFGNRMTSYMYYSDHFATPWICAPYALAIEGDRKYMMAHGVDGMLNLLYPEGYWWQESLNMYLAGRCFFDPSMDPFKLLQDYAEQYYGPKAGPLMAAYYGEWARNPEWAYRVRGASRAEDRAALAKRLKEFINPALAAVQARSVYAHRLQKAEEIHHLAEDLMDMHLRVQELQRLREAGREQEAKQKTASAMAAYNVLVESVKSLIDLDEGLVDKELLVMFIPRIRNFIEGFSGAAGR